MGGMARMSGIAYTPVEEVKEETPSPKEKKRKPKPKKVKGT